MEEKKNEVIKTLNELVRLFKERDTVRRILQAKDAKAVYEEVKAAVRHELESFKEMMLHFIVEFEYPISDVSEVISPENVVEICFILLMSGFVDEYDLADNGEEIELILNQVKGEQREIADRFSKFLYDEYKSFSNYTEETLLNKLLL